MDNYLGHVNSSFLFRTGVYKEGEELEGEDKPKFIVKNFYEAVKLIFQLEHLPFN